MHLLIWSKRKSIDFIWVRLSNPILIIFFFCFSYSFRPSISTDYLYSYLAISNEEEQKKFLEQFEIVYIDFGMIDCKNTSPLPIPAPAT